MTSTAPSGGSTGSRLNAAERMQEDAANREPENTAVPRRFAHRAALLQYHRTPERLLPAPRARALRRPLDVPLLQRSDGTLCRIDISEGVEFRRHGLCALCHAE